MLWAIVRMLKLDVLQAKGLSYKSNFTSLPSRVYFPLEGRTRGLDGAEGMKGSDEIKRVMKQYFSSRGKSDFKREGAQVARIMREAKSVRSLQARGLPINTSPHVLRVKQRRSPYLESSQARLEPQHAFPSSA